MCPNISVRFKYRRLPDICLPPLRECIEFPPVSKEAVQEQKKRSRILCVDRRL